MDHKHESFPVTVSQVIKLTTEESGFKIFGKSFGKIALVARVQQIHQINDREVNIILHDYTSDHNLDSNIDFYLAKSNGSKEALSGVDHLSAVQSSLSSSSQQLANSDHDQVEQYQTIVQASERSSPLNYRLKVDDRSVTDDDQDEDWDDEFQFPTIEDLDTIVIGGNPDNDLIEIREWNMEDVEANFKPYSGETNVDNLCRKNGAIFKNKNDAEETPKMIVNTGISGPSFAQSDLSAHDSIITDECGVNAKLLVNKIKSSKIQIGDWVSCEGTVEKISNLVLLRADTIHKIDDLKSVLEHAYSALNGYKEQKKSATERGVCVSQRFLKVNDAESLAPISQQMAGRRKLRANKSTSLEPSTQNSTPDQ